jgi:hypothetical protein
VAGVYQYRIGFCIGIAISLFPAAAQPAAWTLSEGTGQAIMTTTTTSAERSFDGSFGATTATPRYNKFEFDALMEYGWTDNLTLIATPSLQHIDVAAPFNGQRTGLGDFEFGARYRLMQGNAWVFSAQTTVLAPGTGDVANPAAIGYTDVETDVRGLFGYSFSIFDRPAFANLEFAERFRFGDLPDEFHSDLTFGLEASKKWLLLAQSFNVMSEGAGSAPFASYEYYKLQLSAVYRFTPWLALQVGGITTYAGRNALQENGVVVGLWYRF